MTHCLWINLENKDIEKDVKGYGQVYTIDCICCKIFDESSQFRWVQGRPCTQSTGDKETGISTAMEAAWPQQGSS